MYTQSTKFIYQQPKINSITNSLDCHEATKIHIVIFDDQKKTKSPKKPQDENVIKIWSAKSIQPVYIILECNILVISILVQLL